MAPRHASPPPVRAVTVLGVVAPPPIQVETPVFEGSLATLFGCAREGRVDLVGIALLPICEAYFDYLARLEAPPLDEAAVALIALAYLLERKAWALLPSSAPAPEVEPPLAIEPSAILYQSGIAALAAGHEARGRLYFRPAAAAVEAPLGAIPIRMLGQAFQRLVRETAPVEVEPTSRPRLCLADEMEALVARIGCGWRSLGEVLDAPSGRTRAVFAFLAALELIRVGRLRARLGEGDVELALA